MFNNLYEVILCLLIELEQSEFAIIEALLYILHDFIMLSIGLL